MAAPLLTLTTDFGAGSGYPAQVKAVLLSAVPDARLVDVSHEVPRFDVLGGALVLEACAPWFPAGTIHLGVVDPGVGTSRRAVCVVDAEGRTFVGPDNGLFTPFLGDGARAFEIAPGAAVPAPRTATFHGRDLFAPAAAFLAKGGAPAALGPALPDPARLAWPVPEVGRGELRGEALAADPFGNLVTSIRAADIADAAVLRVVIAGRPARWVRTFGEGEPGELLAMIGSGGRVEVAVREGSAAVTLGGTRGIPVRLHLGPTRSAC